MNTIGDKTRRIFEHVDRELICIGFPTTQELPLGTVVELNNSGEVIAAANNSTKAIGFVYRGKDHQDHVAVNVTAKAVLFAQAKGAITAGDLIGFEGADAITNEKATVSTVTADAIGIALSDAADGGDVKVAYIF